METQDFGLGSEYENQNKFFSSINFLDLTIRVNVLSTLCIVILGILGNALTTFVFIQKKFRINSSSVYLLCMSVIDTLFLILHFFEDTFRISKEIFFKHDPNSFTNFSTNDSPNRFRAYIEMINITDKFGLSCSLINYFRYVLRFISAYIIVVFTVQRVIIIYHPLKKYLISKRSAWKKSSVITVISLCINIWVPFVFEIKKHGDDDERMYCEVKERWRREYFICTFAYIIVIMFVPIVTTIICNALILYSTTKAEIKRKKFQNINPSNRRASELSVSVIRLNSVTSNKRNNWYIRTEFQVFIDTCICDAKKPKICDCNCNSKRNFSGLKISEFLYFVINLIILVK